MPEWRSLEYILFFSEDGPCHVQRRLVTGKKLVHPLCLRMRGREGGGTGRGPSQEYLYISCGMLVKETSRSLGNRQVLTTAMSQLREGVGGIFGTQKREQASTTPAGSANTSVQDIMRRRH
jgi:hypothetical protein